METQTQLKYTLDNLIGVSPALAALKEQVRLAARGPGTVLLLGETGTGKELLAHALHAASPRASGPFVVVNCAAIPAELIEAEFFGYAPGAFTGAAPGGHKGKFERAHGGTLFLDEISELSLTLQAKLLRALQEKEVERLGGGGPVRLDVRVVAASNQDLQALVAAGQFRADLFWRLNVITLRVPPLRDRLEDVIPLAAHFLEWAAAELDLPAPALSAAAATALLAHTWPGNVRELANAMQRAVHLDCGPVLTCRHLPPEWAAAGPAEPAGTPGNAAGRREGIRRVRRLAEHQAITQALERTGGNKARAARLLGLSRSQLYEKLKQR